MIETPSTQVMPRSAIAAYLCRHRRSLQLTFAGHWKDADGTRHHDMLAKRAVFVNERKSPTKILTLIEAE